MTGAGGGGGAGTGLGGIMVATDMGLALTFVKSAESSHSIIDRARGGRCSGCLARQAMTIAETSDGAKALSRGVEYLNGIVARARDKKRLRMGRRISKENRGNKHAKPCPGGFHAIPAQDK